MSDLTEFLLARIAEDEADARHSGADAMTGYRWKHYPRDAYEEIQALALGQARRILAECEAKRSLVGLLKSDSRDPHNAMRREWAVEILRTFATIHADHSDYREEWRA